MKILELIENRQPSRFVAGRDFTLIPKSEYQGYVLGMDDGSDLDATKSNYSVYKYVGQYDFQHGDNTLTNEEYIKIHDVVDPSTGNIHSPYVNSQNVAKMYKYTVDKLRSGKLHPEQVVVEPAEGPIGDDIDPQGLPGQPESNRENNKLSEKFYGGLSPNYSAPSLKNLLYIWIKKNGNWEFFKQANSTEEARAIASRISVSTRAETAIGNEHEPIMLSNGALLSNTYTKGSQTSSSITSQTEFPDSAQGAIQCLRAKGVNTSGAVARAYDGIKGKWIVRHRGGETIVDIVHNQIQNLKEAVFFKKPVTESKKKI